MRTTRVSIGALLAALALAACNSEAEEAAAAPPPPPPEVGVVVVSTETVPLTDELVGRTAAFETSEVRPQVSGIVQARLFEEGAHVEQGETLYQIDPSLFEAAVAEAKANLDAALAVEERARVQAARLEPLTRKGIASEQTFDNAEADALAARAAVAQARARLATAEINLRFAKVPAPISGRIGRSLVTTGALVSAGQTEALATIQRLDPIFVDIQQSSAAILSLRRELARGDAVPDSAAVRLVLEDGEPYALPGTLEFSEVTVAPDTGTVTLRAHFPNPDGLLLPGMYVRAVVTQREVADAVLVPQAAVMREPGGAASVLVVGEGDKAVRRDVVADRAIGDRWLVAEGLKAGERVVVEGTAKVKPDESVRPVDVAAEDVAADESKDAARGPIL